MTWLVLLVVVVALVIYLRKRTNEPQGLNSPAAAEVVPAFHENARAQDNELIAVLTAAIAEFEGGGDFQVVSIRSGGRNWKLAGQMDLLGSRR